MPNSRSAMKALILAVLRQSRKMMYFKSVILIPLFREFTRFLDYFYPKDDKTIVFGSDGAKRVSGDPKGMFEFMREHHPEYDVYFFTNNPKEN